MKDILIGQYYQIDSKIHRLDPRVKLLATLLYIIGVLIVDTAVGYGVATLFLAMVILVSKVPFKYIIKGLKAIIFIVVFSVVFILLFTPGQKVILKFGIISVSYEGAVAAGQMLIRMILLITGASIVTLTTKPNDITDGLEKAFNPLNRIKVPVHEIAMMISIAFRFIPTLMEEAQKIMTAQKIRGANFDNGGLIKKAKGLIPIIIPLIMSSIRRALDLANAMEARCYRGGVGRTKMRPLIYKKEDYIGYFVLAIFLIVLISADIMMKNALR